MAEKTAVDWLFEQIPVEWTSTKYAFDAYQQARQIHEYQVITAYRVGKAESSMPLEKFITGEQYYNETFG
jgi:hypothetical protein